MCFLIYEATPGSPRLYTKINTTRLSSHLLSLTLASDDGGVRFSEQRKWNLQPGYMLSARISFPFPLLYSLLRHFLLKLSVLPPRQVRKMVPL